MGQPSEYPSIYQGLCHMPVGFRPQSLSGRFFPLGTLKCYYHNNNPSLGAGQMDGLELTALVALLEDLGTIPSTKTVARKHL